MNLFPTYPDPIEAAKSLDDKRVHKIALEAAQILSTVLTERGASGLYKPSHQHAGVTCWLRDVPGSLGWTLEYGLALCDVYLTYGKQPVHSSRAMLEACGRALTRRDKRADPARFQNSARNPKYDCDFTHVADTHMAYRMYLAARWSTDRRPVMFTGRQIPKWLLDNQEMYDGH